MAAPIFQNTLRADFPDPELLLGDPISTMAINTDLFYEAVWDIVAEEATTVLTLVWGGGSPGHSGAVWIRMARRLRNETMKVLAPGLRRTECAQQRELA